MMRCRTCGITHSRPLVLPLPSPMMIVIRSKIHRWALTPACLERISLGADGDARGHIETKKKEAPAKRTIKRAERTKKERAPGRTCRWVDTLAWATGTRVGASDHAIAWFCIGYGRVLGFLYGKTFPLHLWFNCAHNCMFVYVVIMWRTL